MTLTELPPPVVRPSEPVKRHELGWIIAIVALVAAAAFGLAFAFAQSEDGAGDVAATTSAPPEVSTEILVIRATWDEAAICPALREATPEKRRELTALGLQLYEASFESESSVPLSEAGRAEVLRLLNAC